MTQRLASVAVLLQAPHLAQQSMIDPAGPKAQHVYDFWRFLISVSVAVFAVVLIALIVALFRRHRTVEPESPRVDRDITRWVVTAVGITFVIILVFLVVDFRLGRANATPDGAKSLTIEVIGHQWWWEIQYPDSADVSNWIVTANEIHVPVGRPVILRMSSRDVIHSFWVPNLSGKKDLVPGKTTETWIRADSAGIYRGQCAEFCGLQHAKMALEVVAQSPADFARWESQMRAPARAPADSLQEAGRLVFVAGSCSNCHAIGGTPAAGHVGPDLTHLSSRRTIAAASLPNTRGNLAGWILDPQRIKPGSAMPANSLDPDQLQSLLAYLEGLK
jgi:cytochrome c oxidase subunit 2